LFLAVSVMLTLLAASCSENDRCLNDNMDEENLPIVQVGDLDEPLIVLEHSTPAYPDEARGLGHEGSVTVKVIVKSDGTVGRSEVSATSGYPELDAAAVEAAMGFKFTQPRRNGCRVRAEVHIPFRFSLSG
jgi:protein TonB